MILIYSSMRLYGVTGNARDTAGEVRIIAKISD